MLGLGDYYWARVIVGTGFSVAILVAYALGIVSAVRLEQLWLGRPFLFMGDVSLLPGPKWSILVGN